MIDRTTLLFALPGFRVLNVTLEPDRWRLVLVESVAKDGGCPSCGVMSSRIKDRPICRSLVPPGRPPVRWRSAARRRTTCATSTSTSTSRSRCEHLVPPLNPALEGGYKYEDNDMSTNG